MIDLAPIRALTFDCYGTLIDWETGISGILNAWAQSVGVADRDDTLLEIYGRHESAVESEVPALLYSDVVREVMRRMGGTPEWVTTRSKSTSSLCAEPANDS